MSSKSILLAAAALAVLPSAAVARDELPYVGIEGGAIKPDKLKLDYQLRALSAPNGIIIDHKTGFDVDFIVAVAVCTVKGQVRFLQQRGTTLRSTISSEAKETIAGVDLP